MDVRVVWGTGSGPTALSAYDAALAAAGVGNYNLLPVSSVLPADATVSVNGTAPDLGPAGARLTVVEACATTSGPGRVAAALGWATGDGPGIVYEAAGTVDAGDVRTGEAAGAAEEAAAETDESDVCAEVEAGLAAGRDLREWSFDDERVESVAAAAEAGVHTAAVVVAALGDAEPL